MGELKRVYLAGKISRSGWRYDLVSNLRNLYREGYAYDLIKGNVLKIPPPFPITKNAIDNYFDYTGPYFVSCDHGCLHNEEHAIGSGYCSGGGAYEHSRLTITTRCLVAVRDSDIVIAYIDSKDTYGTFVELGAAIILGKTVQIFAPQSFDTGYCEADNGGAHSDEVFYIKNELWFPFALSYDGVIFVDDNDPNEPAKSIMDYLQQFKKIDYHEYIKSDEWKERALAAKERAGWRCQLCNKDGDKTSLHAHHRTYERLGKEEPDDITVLCAECHAKFHDK